jgi:hypothetical protein
MQKFSSLDITILQNTVNAMNSQHIRNTPTCISISNIQSGSKFNPFQKSKIDQNQKNANTKSFYPQHYIFQMFDTKQALER